MWVEMAEMRKVRKRYRYTSKAQKKIMYGSDRSFPDLFSVYLGWKSKITADDWATGHL